MGGKIGRWRGGAGRERARKGRLGNDAGGQIRVRGGEAGRRGRAGDGAKAPPPDIASGGYERRAAFELWRLDAATLVARPERPSAKYTIFAPGRHSSKATESRQSRGKAPACLITEVGQQTGNEKGAILITESEFYDSGTENGHY